MAQVMKGITITIDGNTTGLNDALKDVNKEVSKVNGELKQVRSLLKLDPGNVELVAQKQTLLTKAIQETSTKLLTLKEAKRQADKDFQNGKIGEEQYRELNREIIKTKSALDSYTNELRTSKNGTNSLTEETKKLKKAQEDTSKSTSVFGDVLKANLSSAVIIGGVKAIANGVAQVSKEIGKFIGYSVKLASDLEEVQNVVDVTFGKATDTVNKFAIEAGASFGLSELQAKKFAGTTGAMFKSMGLSEKDVTKMSTSITGLAGDFASFYNLDPEEAFNKLRSGISGETEPLKQLGINMSVANLEAYALKEGITKSYNAMSEAEKATLRYNYLMKVSSDAQGDYARTSDSLANQLRTMKLGFQSISGSIGKEFIPAFTGVIKPLNTAMSEINKIIYDGFQNGDNAKIDKVVNKLAEDLGAALNVVIPKIVGILVPLLNTLVKTLVTILPTLLPQLLTGFLQLLQSLYTALAQNITPLAQMVMSMVKSLAQFFIDNAPMLLQAGITLMIELAKGLAENMPVMIPQILDMVMEIINVILDNLDDFIEAGILVTMALIDGLITWFTDDKNIDKIIEIVVKIAKVIMDNAPKLIAVGLILIGKLLVGIVEGVVKLIGKIPKLMGDLVNAFLSSDIVSGFIDIGGDLIKGIWSGIKKGWEWMKEKGKEWSKNVKNWFKDLFGIHSPSTMMRDEIGLNLGLGMAEGVEKSMKFVQEAVKKANTTIMGEVGGVTLQSPGTNNVVLNITTQSLNEGEQDMLIKKINLALGNQV